MNEKLSRYENALRQIMNAADDAPAEELRIIATNALFHEIKNDNPEQQEVAFVPLQKVIITITDTDDGENGVKVSTTFEPDIAADAAIGDSPALSCWSAMMGAIQGNMSKP